MLSWFWSLGSHGGRSLTTAPAVGTVVRPLRSADDRFHMASISCADCRNYFHFDDKTSIRYEMTIYLLTASVLLLSVNICLSPSLSQSVTQ